MTTAIDSAFANDKGAQACFAQMEKDFIEGASPRAFWGHKTERVENTLQMMDTDRFCLIAECDQNGWDDEAIATLKHMNRWVHSAKAYLQMIAD